MGGGRGDDSPSGSISVRVPRYEPFLLLPRGLSREWRGPRPYGRDGPPSRDGQLRGAWQLHRDGGLRGYDAPQPTCDAAPLFWTWGLLGLAWSPLR
jgi:hypothetical protein